jgi:hypothetical protein
MRPNVNPLYLSSWNTSYASMTHLPDRGRFWPLTVGQIVTSQRRRRHA